MKFQSFCISFPTLGWPTFSHGCPFMRSDMLTLLQTEKEELRYAVGVIVEETENMTKEVLIQRLEEDAYKFFRLPSSADEGQKTSSQSGTITVCMLKMRN